MKEDTVELVAPAEKGDETAWPPAPAESTSPCDESSIQHREPAPVLGTLLAVAMFVLCMFSDGYSLYSQAVRTVILVVAGPITVAWLIADLVRSRRRAAAKLGHNRAV